MKDKGRGHKVEGEGVWAARVTDGGLISAKRKAVCEKVIAGGRRHEA